MRACGCAKREGEGEGVRACVWRGKWKWKWKEGTGEGGRGAGEGRGLKLGVVGFVEGRSFVGWTRMKKRRKRRRRRLRRICVDSLSWDGMTRCGWVRRARRMGCASQHHIEGSFSHQEIAREM